MISNDVKECFEKYINFSDKEKIFFRLLLNDLIKIGKLKEVNNNDLGKQ